MWIARKSISKQFCGKWVDLGSKQSAGIAQCDDRVDPGSAICGQKSREKTNEHHADAGEGKRKRIERRYLEQQIPHHSRERQHTEQSESKAYSGHGERTPQYVGKHVLTPRAQSYANTEFAALLSCRIGGYSVEADRGE